MTQFSNDNFEELFKQAAEEYPLKTDNKNWDSLAAQLNKFAIAERTKRRKWQYAAVLLLFLATGAFFILNNSRVGHVSKKQDQGRSSVNKTADHQPKQDNNVSKDISTPEAKSINIRPPHTTDVGSTYTLKHIYHIYN